MKNNKDNIGIALITTTVVVGTALLAACAYGAALVIFSVVM